MEHSTHHQNQEYHMNLNQGATYKTQNQISRSSSSLGSRSVMWLGRMPQHATSKFACLALSFARSCLSSIYPSCLSTASMISLAVCSCPSGHTSVPSVVFEAVGVPCPGPFNVFTLLIMTFVLSLIQMLVLLSLYVMLGILISILVCAAASLFCAPLVGVHVSAPYATAGSAQELYTV